MLNSPEKQNSRYIPLAEAGEILGTSRDYLNVLVRRGKLRAVKLGRNWFTTCEWLSEYQTPTGKLEQEEKAELASLRDASLAERLQRVESQVVSLRGISRMEKNFQTFKDKEISERISTSVASQEIQLPSRLLAPDEKAKILEAVKERIKTADSHQFQNASKKLGISRSLKSWSLAKLFVASGLTALFLVVSFGMATGILNFQIPIFNFQNGLKYQASIFSNVFKNFPSDIPQFSNWLAEGINKSFSIFGPSQTDLTIEELESGKSKLLKPEEAPYRVSTLAEAEALDSFAEEEVSPSFVKAPADAKAMAGMPEGNFTLFDNRLSIVEINLQEQTDLINSELSLQKKTILGTLETLFGLAKLVPIHPISTIVVQGQPATLTTYSVVPQTQTGFDRLSATYFSVANDATINGSLTVKSGGNFNSLSVSGNTSLTGNATIGGTLAVTGDSSFAGASFSGNVGIGTSTPNTTALLDLTSTSKGLLPPRMTTAQKNSIASPASGLMIFDTNLAKLNVYNGTVWKNVGNPEIGGDVTGGTSGSVLYVDSSGFLGQDNSNFFWDASLHSLGIGTSTPNTTALLDLTSTSTGFLPPRMTTAQKNSIASPASGLMLFDTNLAKLNVYNGTVWKNVGNPEIGGDVTGGTSGSVLYVDSSGFLAQDNANFFWDASLHNLGIGTTTPNQKLTVWGNGMFYGTLSASSTAYLPTLVTTNGTITNASSTYSTSSDTSWFNNLVATNATTTTFRSSGLATFGGNVGIGTTGPTQKLHVEGQCVTGDTLLPIVKFPPYGGSPVGGQNVQIKDIKGGEYVMSLNEETGKIVPAKIKGLLDMGVKPIYKITTEDGKTIRTTGNHPYLTQQGWQKVADLSEEAEIAVANDDLAFLFAQSQKDNKETNSQQHGDDNFKNSIDIHKLFSFATQINDNGDNYSQQTADNIEHKESGGDIVGIHNYSLLNNKLNDQKPTDDSNPRMINGQVTDFSISEPTTNEAKNTCPISRQISDKVSNLNKNENINSDCNNYTNPKTDVKFVKIAKIEFLPAEQVYDIEVEGTHNFVANGIIAHNTYISGNVGIGNISPTEKLNVQGTISAQNFTATSTSLYSTFPNASSTYSTSSDTSWFNNLVATNATTTTFRASGLATFGGNVGIGTTTPSAKLSVQGDSYLYGNLTVTGSGGIDSNLTVTGQIFLADGTAAAPSLTFTNDINLGLFKAGTDILGFTTNGSEKMRIDASGNVAIGTTTTTYAQVNIGNNLAVLGTASSSFNGLVQFNGIPTGTDVNKGSIYLNPTSAGTNNVIFGVAVGGTEQVRIDAEGDVQIVGLFNSTNTTGTNDLFGHLNIRGNTTLGSDTSDTVTFTGRVNSDIVPFADMNYNIGTPQLRFNKIYAGELVATSTTVGGTASSTFIINTDNLTNDTEDSSLQFSRGIASPNAILKWDYANQQFNLNFPLYLQGTLLGSGTASSSFAGPVWFTGASQGTATSSAIIYINPSSGPANYNLFDIAVNGVERMRVDAEGDTSIWGSLGVENNIYDLSQDTLTIDDNIQINGGSVIKDSGGNSRITLGSTNVITGNLTTSLNLGAATTSITYPLSVQGNSYLYGNLTVTGNANIASASTTNLTIVSNLWTGASSTVSFGGALLLSDGSASAPSLAFTNDIDSGLYRIDTNRMSFVTNAADRLTLDANGNVGIGTTTPNDSLDVYKSQVGQTKLAIINPNAAGSASLNIGTNSIGEAGLTFYNSGYVTTLLRSSLEIVTAGSGNILLRSGGYVGIGSMYGSLLNPQATADIGSNDSYNNTIVDEAILRHNTTGTAGSGLGAALSFWGQAAEGTNQQLGRIAGVVEQATTTAATFGSYLSFWTVGTGGIQEKMRITSSGQLALATTTIPSGYGMNIATSTFVYGNLNVSNNSIFNNSSTTNATLTNFWSTSGTITTLNSTNGTITNASTTYTTLPTFWGTTGNVTNLTTTNASTTYATLPTFWSTTGTIGTLNLTNALTVANGGTGASTLLDHGVLVGSGTDAITPLAAGTNGQLLVGSTGADPVFAALNCANGLTCTTGAGTLQVDFDGGDSPGGSLGNTWASPTIDDLFILNTGDVGTGIYTFPELNFTNATGTRLFATNGTITNASTTYATLPTFWGTTGTITNLTATNASTTYATIPTFWSSNANITGGTITGITDLTVADGGTGASTLTGFVYGNGASAMTATTTPYFVNGIYMAATSTMNGYNICTSANGVCAGGASLTGTTGQVAYFSGTNTAVGTSTIFLSTAGNVGIGTTSPNSLLTLTGTSPQVSLTTSASQGQSGWVYGIDTSDANKFKIASSTSSLSTNTRLTIDGNGNVGIGLTGPNRKLDILDASAAQLRLTYSDNLVYTDFNLDTIGNLTISPAENVYLKDIANTGANLWVCEGTACPSLSLTDGGNLVVENDIYLSGDHDTVARHSCPSGWVLVPGNSNFGTQDFCVMEYEAKQDATTKNPVSTAAGTPWVNVSQYEAKNACNKAGAHLVNEAEWMTIARNIASTTINDLDSDASLQLGNGNANSAAAYAAVADPVISGCDLTKNLEDNANAWTGTCQLRGTNGNTADFGYTHDGSSNFSIAYNAGADSKAHIRTHVLSNGEIIWDIAGNVWEWTDAQCDTTSWDPDAAWAEWNEADLTDYEQIVGSLTSYTSANGIGQYYGCTVSENGFLRGGTWAYGAGAGAFTLALNIAPTTVYSNFGFRCAR